MPFNYNPQVRYNPMSQATIKAASKSPFEIAGKAMSGLDEAIENRAFNRDIAGVKDLQGLAGLNPQSDKSRALYAAKQSGFNALNQQQDRINQQQNREELLQLQKQQFEREAAGTNLANQEARRAFEMKDMAQGRLDVDSMIASGITPTQYAQSTGLESLGVPTDGVATKMEQLSLVDRINSEKALGQTGTFDLLKEGNDTAIAKAKAKNTASQKGRYKSAVNNITGQVEVLDTWTGKFGLPAKGTLPSVTDQGVTINSKTATAASADGSVMYISGDGKPLTTNGVIQYKTRSKEAVTQTQADASMQNVFNKLDLFNKTVTDNPKAIGSFGENPLNYILNNVNDYLKMETPDRMSRSNIIQFNDALAASLRKISGEVGTMTDADVLRYIKMLGDEDDNTAEYKQKLSNLRKTMIEDMKNKKLAFGKEVLVDNNEPKNQTEPLVQNQDGTQTFGGHTYDAAGKLIK